MRLPFPDKFKNHLFTMRANLIFSARWMRGLLWPPIIVLTMGKVGSKTIALSLRKSHLPNPVFDTHFMAQDHIDKADEFQRSLGLTKTPWGHIRGKHLRQLGKLTWGRSRWKIITLVRRFSRLCRFISLRTTTDIWRQLNERYRITRNTGA